MMKLKAGQGVLEEVQDSMSETERGKRLGAQRKKGIPKKKGPSTDPGSEEVRERGKDTPEEKRKERGKEAPQKKSLYPVKELEALGLDGSDSNEELSPTDEEDLEEEAARYEEERYHPDERWPSKSERKSKRNGSKESGTNIRDPNGFQESTYQICAPQKDRRRSKEMLA
ncbi:mCG1049523 [Mus musculus]|nr:mCG1049523 [Mus musculus]